MAEFNSSMLTRKGIQLLTKIQAGQCALSITKAASGNGTYTDRDNPANQTELKRKRQEFALTAWRIQNQTNIYVKFIITNCPDEQHALTEGYYVTEVGLYATDPDEGEILYAIATAATADYLQSYNGLIASTMTVEMLTEVGNASSVTLVMPNQPTIYDDVTGDAISIGASGGIPYVDNGGVKMFLVTQDALAPAYDRAATYAAGETCAHGGAIYKCITPVNAYTEAYIVGDTPYADGWLSLTEGGEPISGAASGATVYKIVTSGAYAGNTIKWDSSESSFKEHPLLEDFDSAKWEKTTMAEMAKEGGGSTIVQIPKAERTSFTYDGEVKALSFSNLDRECVTVTNASATEPGTYTATLALKNAKKMVWTDMTTESKTVTWTVGKATGGIALSGNDIVLNGSSPTKTISLTVVGDGALTAASSRTDIATAAVSGSTATIRNAGEKNGAATITFTLAEGPHYTGATATLRVTCDFVKIFAFHYSENDSNPNSVTYPAGYHNSGFTDPFYVDLATGTPHYGDWDPNGRNANAVRWMYPRSCMLKYNGTRDYYLNENDETKKEDGTASDVANMNYGGNAMMEWGQDGRKIYWKIVPDADGKGFTFVVANGDAGDAEMKPWNHYDCNGRVADHFYTPKYFGSSDGTRLRSISGGTNYVSHTASEELAQAKANNQGSSVIWNTEVYADWIFLAMMEVLLCKSMNTQAKFGHGRCASSNTSAIGQGTMNGKGLFFGKSDQTSGVKIFGMENPHGNLWRRIAGLVNVSGTVKLKLTYGRQDGSTADGYNMDGTGYITHGTIGGTSGGFTSHMHISKHGITPSTISGSDSTYYTDGGWFNNAQTDYAFVGGGWGSGLHVGAFCCALSHAASYANAAAGAALSCKPLAA